MDPKAYLRAHGFRSNWAFDYPWNPSTAITQVSYAPARRRAAQRRCSISTCGAYDADFDGLGDDWGDGAVSIRGAKTGPCDDYDGDGLTNLEEFQAGLDPKSVDSDYDGRSDRQELLEGTNPKDAASALAKRLGYFG